MTVDTSNEQINANAISVREALGTMLAIVNLSSVVAATNGAAVQTGHFPKKTVFIEVTGNTGAVTVNIEGSPDGTTWYDVDSQTYTATNAKDSYSYHQSHFPYMRTTTTTQSNSTVKTTITGGAK